MSLPACCPVSLSARLQFLSLFSHPCSLGTLNFVDFELGNERVITDVSWHYWQIK